MFKILSATLLMLVASEAFAGTGYYEACDLTPQEVDLIAGPTYVPETTNSGEVPKDDRSLLLKKLIGNENRLSLYEAKMRMNYGAVVSAAYSKSVFKSSIDSKGKMPIYCVGIAKGGLAWGVGSNHESLQVANAVILSHFLSAPSHVEVQH